MQNCCSNKLNLLILSIYFYVFLNYTYNYVPRCQKSCIFISNFTNYSVCLSFHKMIYLKNVYFIKLMDLLLYRRIVFILKFSSLAKKNIETFQLSYLYFNPTIFGFVFIFNEFYSFYHNFIFVVTQNSVTCVRPSIKQFCLE